LNIETKIALRKISTDALFLWKHDVVECDVAERCGYSRVRIALRCFLMGIDTKMSVEKLSIYPLFSWKTRLKVNAMLQHDMYTSHNRVFPEKYALVETFFGVVSAFSFQEIVWRIP
jgi:hypothetical protein